MPPAAYCVRILSTSSVLNFSCVQRALSERSLAFWTASPKYKCAGLTHFLLSHLCKTHAPSGISPTYSRYETRCAGACLLSNQNFPYPLWLRVDCHSWHSVDSSLLTLLLNLVRRSTSSSVNHALATPCSKRLLTTRLPCHRIGITIASWFTLFSSGMMSMSASWWTTTSR